jgi:imidazolonepropionase-like amidohydrolase
MTAQRNITLSLATLCLAMCIAPAREVTVAGKDSMSGRAQTMRGLSAESASSPVGGVVIFSPSRADGRQARGEINGGADRLAAVLESAGLVVSRVSLLASRVARGRARSSCLFSAALSLIVGLSFVHSLAQSEQVTVLVGGTVIDGHGGAPLPGAVVLIRGNKILQVGSKGEVKFPQTAKVIDATGKFILPGLIDLHVHYDGWMGELFLAHGVTTIKDLGNDVEWISTISAEVEQERVRGPRIFYVGNAIDAPPPAREHHIGLDSAELAARAVELLGQRGVAAIKVREKITPELLRAVTQKAHKLGIPVTGHIGQTDARQAALAGIDGLEHCSGIVEATAAQIIKPDPGQNDVQRFIAEIKAYAYIDSAKARELVKFLASKKVALIPTMSNWWRMASERRDEFAREDAEYANNPMLAYVPDQILQVWATSFLYNIRNADDLAQVKAGYRKVQELIRQHHQVGGKVLAGSDTLLSVPGRSLQRELIFLVDAGLTPMQAISTATRDNAQFLGQGKELGTITTGKLADLVVLGANPLEDIRNVQKVEMVFKNGQVVDRTYHVDYSIPTPKPKLTRPLWIEQQLQQRKVATR